MLIYSTGCMLENDGLSFSLVVGRFIIYIIRLMAKVMLRSLLKK